MQTMFRCSNLRRAISGALTVSAALALLATALLAADDRAPGGADASKARQLFDGKTLEGWTETDFTGKGEVYVEDGKIILDTGFITGVHLTKDIPKINYEVNLDAMRVDGSDFFCGLTFPFKKTHITLIVGGWGGGVTGLSCVDGFDASENETTSYLRYEKGKWYHVRLKVAEDLIEAWIDNEKVVDLPTKNREFSLRVGEMDLSIPFGIAAYNTKAALKNIKILPLPPKKSSTP